MGGGASMGDGVRRHPVTRELVAVSSSAMEALAPAFRQVHEALPEAVCASGQLVVAAAQSALSMVPRTMNEAIEMVATRLNRTPSWDSLMASLPTASRPIFRAASVHSGSAFRDSYTLERVDLALTIVEHHTAALRSEPATHFTLGEKGLELLPWSVAMVNFHRMALHDAAQWDGRGGPAENGQVTEQTGHMRHAICELSELVVSQYELHADTIASVLDAAASLRREPLSTDALREAVQEEVACRRAESVILQERLATLHDDKDPEAEALRKQLMSNVRESRVLLLLEREAKSSEARQQRHESEDIAERIEKLQQKEHVAAPVAPGNELTPPTLDGPPQPRTTKFYPEMDVVEPRKVLPPSKDVVVPVRSNAMRTLCGDAKGIIVKGAAEAAEEAIEELEILELADVDQTGKDDGPRNIREGWAASSQSIQSYEPDVDTALPTCTGDEDSVKEAVKWAQKSEKSLPRADGSAPPSDAAEAEEDGLGPPSIVQIVMPSQPLSEPDEERKTWATTTTSKNAARVVVVQPKRSNATSLQESPQTCQELGLVAKLDPRLLNIKRC